MSAPVFIAPAATLHTAVPGGSVIIRGSEARHAIAVQRLRAGEKVELVDGAGMRARGVVDASSTPEELHVQVEALEAEDLARPQVIVVQALAKGDRGERAVEVLTEVGVDRIVPWAAEHCVVRWKSDREEKSHAKWVTTSVEAAKQARRSRFVQIDPLATTADVVALIGQVDRALVLDESATEPIPVDAGAGVASIAVIVGPEGGISSAERTRFLDAGARLALLGPTVLRTSTAGVVAASVILAGTSRWQHDRIAPKGDVSD